MGIKKIAKRVLEADPVYNSVVVERLVNQVMRKGKKTIARKIVYGAFDIIKDTTKKDPQEIFDLAVRNTSPLLEVKPKRVGGAIYQVPREVKGDRRLALSMRWLISGAKGRKGKAMKEKISAEIIDASNNTGWAVKKREDIHRMAEANRAFAHFSW